MSTLKLVSLRGDEDAAAIVAQFSNALQNVVQRAVTQPFDGRLGQSLGKPSTTQLFDGTHIDDAIVEVFNELWHESIKQCEIDTVIFMTKFNQNIIINQSRCDPSAQDRKRTDSLVHKKQTCQ